jgi:hypothetical protein
MPLNEQNDNNDQSDSAGNLAKFTGLAFQMIAIIGAFTYGGYRIDKAAGHTTQWATATLALIGVFISFYVVFKSLKN